MNPGPLWQSSETDLSSAPREGAVLKSRPRTGLEVTRLQPPNPHHRPSSTPRLALLGRVEPEIGTFVWRLLAWGPRDPESLSPGGPAKDIFTR